VKGLLNVPLRQFIVLMRRRRELVLVELGGIVIGYRNWKSFLKIVQ